MSRRTSVILALAVALVGTAAFAWIATREEIASGSGKKGDWRIVASWDFGSYCLKRYHEKGEGGACGFAKPGTLNESISWRVFTGESAATVLAGPVPLGATRVQITPQGGDPVIARLTKVVRMTFYFAEIPGVQAIEDIRALDDHGQVVERNQHGSLPPPGP